MRESDPTIEIVSCHGDQQRDHHYYTVGYHPWWTSHLLGNVELDFLRNKYHHDPFCLAIGECGLDNLKGSPLDLQQECFSQQITVANELHAPVVVHCVRAYDRLMRIHREMGETAWVVHGYLRNKILAKQLLDAGFYISIAPTEKMSNSFVETLSYLPLDRVFIETDSDPSYAISERYQIFAAVRQMKVEDVQAQILVNISQFYINKWKHPNG